MRVSRLIAACILASTLMWASATQAAKAVPGITYLRSAPAQLHPRSAYLLIRASTAKSGLFSIQQVLLRVPSPAETEAFRVAKRAAYEKELPKLTKKAKGGPIPTLDQFPFDYDGTPNAFAVRVSDYLEDGPMRTILLEVPPGRYVLYGVTVGDRAIGTCNCLGTVSFEAVPGTITDVGSLYADKVHKASPVPHLEDSLGEQMFEYGFVLGAALVPPSDAQPVSPMLHMLPIVRAQYRAEGPFLEPGANWINRLAPIPGILDYRDGKPVDVPSGRIVE